MPNDKQISDSTKATINKLMVDTISAALSRPKNKDTVAFGYWPSDKQWHVARLVIIEILGITVIEEIWHEIFPCKHKALDYALHMAENEHTFFHFINKSK